MGSRPKRTIARLLVAICVVGLLAAGVWLALGPGSEPAAKPIFPVSALVPDGVAVILSTSWPELRDSALLRTGLFELPEVVDAQTILRALRGDDPPLDRASDPVRMLLPDFADFSYERDVFAGEVILAGELGGLAVPAGELPRIGELLLLTRISPELARALADPQLTTERAQARLAPEVTLTDLGGGVLRADRQVQAAAPADTWYVLRMDDVVACGTSERLLRRTAALAEGITESGGWPASFELASRSRPGGLTAYVELERLREYLSAVLREAEVPAALLRHWLRTSTFEALELHVGGAEPQGVLAEAYLHYEPGRLTPEIRSTYGLWPRSFEEAATLVPAADTFALVAVRSPSELALEALFGEFLTAANRAVWSEAFLRMGSERQVAQTLDQMQSALGETWTLALARPGTALDQVEYEGFFPAGPVRPDPSRPAWALLVSLSDDADAELLVGDLNALLAMMGISTESVPYREHMLHLPQPDTTYVDLWWVPAVWLVTEEHLILASEESYARSVVDTLVDPDAVPPLTTDPVWRETTIPLPDKVLAGVYVDLQRLFRVPPTAAAQSQPRGYLWDRRSLWVAEHFDPRDAAEKHRRQLLAEHVEGGGSIDARAVEEIEVAVDRYAEAWILRYPEFVETYRQKLADYGHLRGLGITIHADAEILHGDAYLGVTPPTGR